jgi:8-oxo-dGTP pyrophosphatase MutT (NUDIX family)
LQRQSKIIGMIEKHFTATAYIIQNGKVLLIPHVKLDKWLPPGGHVEENETPPECAVREALEETGLEIQIIPQENIWIEASNAISFERPYLCLLENIPAYGTKPAHQHMDFVYLAKPLRGSLLPEAKWFSLAEVEALSDEVEIFGETKKTIHHILTERPELQKLNF